MPVLGEGDFESVSERLESFLEQETYSNVAEVEFRRCMSDDHEGAEYTIRGEGIEVREVSRFFDDLEQYNVKHYTVTALDDVGGGENGVRLFVYDERQK